MPRAWMVIVFDPSAAWPIVKCGDVMRSILELIPSAQFPRRGGDAGTRGDAWGGGCSRCRGSATRAFGRGVHPTQQG